MLLAVQLGGVLVYPFLDDSAFGRAVISFLGLVVLFLAVRTVEATPALTWISIVLGIPIAILVILEVVYPESTQYTLWASLLLAVFYFYTSYALIRYMFHDSIVTRDELWAIGATFTVVAWAFAYTFVVVQLIWPSSFIDSTGSTGPFSWFTMLYLSFANLTSVGLSDIYPVAPQARSWVMIEQIAGVLYLALVVSRVVGLTINRARDSSGRS